MPYALSQLDVRENAELYARLPRVCTTLEPGDALLSPSWWWHRVENLAPVNVGVSSRWITTRWRSVWPELANHAALGALFPEHALLWGMRMFGYDPGAPEFLVGDQLQTDWLKK